MTCSSCSKSLRLNDTLAGKSIKCPQCATVLRVPGATAVTLPKPPPASAPVANDEEDDNLRPAPGAKRVRAEAAPAGGNLKEAPTPSRVLDDSSVPDELRERIKEELTKGEKLVWIGQPDPKLVFLKNAAVCAGAALILLFLTVIAIRGMATAKKVEFGHVIMLLIGVIGLVAAIATPFFQRWKATKSCYAVTSRRAIVIDRNIIGAAIMTNYNPADLAGMRRREWWFFQDAGDVIFRTKVTITVTDHYARGPGGGYRGSSISKKITLYGFLSIRRPREVELLIRETLVDPVLDKLNA
jgi:hypothetical protein